MHDIHPTAVISSDARLGTHLTIGPFCVVEAGAEIGDHCTLAARAVVKSDTQLGNDNQVGEGAVLGGRPQHLHAGEHVGRLIIGNGNQIRENATIHRGLSRDTATRVGEGNFIMVNAHIGHDCQVGDHTILANNVMLAGHVTLGDRAYVSGAVGVHQFCRIGRLAMVGGQAHVKQDVPPFVTVDGHSSLIVGLNVIGLRRAGFSSAEIQQLKRAYRVIYRSGMNWSETLATLAADFSAGPAAEFGPFLSSTERGVIQERRLPRPATVQLPNAEPKLVEPKNVRRAG